MRSDERFDGPSCKNAFSGMLSEPSDYRIMVLKGRVFRRAAKPPPPSDFSHGGISLFDVMRFPSAAKAALTVSWVRGG